MSKSGSYYPLLEISHDGPLPGTANCGPFEHALAAGRDPLEANEERDFEQVRLGHVGRIASAAGLDAVDGGSRRPFRAPHHTASAAALVGGGDPVRPARSRSRTAACSSSTSCRSSRARDRVAAHHDGVRARGGGARSGSRDDAGAPAGRRRDEPVPVWLLGRADARLHLHPGARRAVPRAGERVAPRSLRSACRAASGAARRSRRRRARRRAPRCARGRSRRARAAERGDPIGPAKRANPARLLERDLSALASDARTLLGLAGERLGLSMRGFSRALRVARTIAHLEGAGRVEAEHVAEALQYRLLDRRVAGAAAGLG